MRFSRGGELTTEKEGQVECSARGERERGKAGRVWSSYGERQPPAGNPTPRALPVFTPGDVRKKMVPGEDTHRNISAFPLHLNS